MDKVQIETPNGEVVEAELISCFELINTGKKYVFYTRNEMVENNLIKMYVAEVKGNEENISIGDKMTDQEWTEIKNVMKSILTGNTNPNIKYIGLGGL
ncbi:MAG TPA: DUF1292 domain-containing protein [Mollicutes bacterium]|jgi:uncharacterized protein YrzB (UPF0473 family)|nr:DUF1292 domain-containing protein [Mollicutes bacterium]